MIHITNIWWHLKPTLFKNIFHSDIASYFLMGTKENCKKIEKYYILITVLFKQLLG